VQITQPWVREEMEIKAGLNEIGVTMTGMKAGDLTDATTVRDMMTGIQVIATDGGTIGVNIDGAIGQGLGPQGGRGLGIGTTGDGGGPRKG